MSKLVFKKADRGGAKLKIAIGGPSGVGKTMSSLLMAYGMLSEQYPNLGDEEIWSKVCIIDTENSSGSLYINTQVGANTIGVYNTIPIDPPFEAQRYIDAIKLAEDNDQEVIIVDSLSHAWSGEGGALDKHGKITARVGNSYTAWREPKEDQNRLMNAILQSKSHVICDIRAKTDYVQEKNDNGKTVVRNIGMGLITQGESEYEYTVLFMLDRDHVANAQKDRTGGLFSGKYFVITPETGRELYRWLVSSKNMQNAIGKTNPAPAPENNTEAATATSSAHDAMTHDELLAEIKFAAEKYLEKHERNELTALLKEVGGTANYNKYDDKTLKLAINELAKHSDKE